MRRMLLFLLAAAMAWTAEDPWTKVKELKTGAELRVFKKGTAQPVMAKMDELTAENLVVIVKNAQVAIPREEIDRIDARPSQTKSRITKETKTKTTDPDTRPAPPGFGSRTPETSTSSTVGIGSKPDFETIYRRPAASRKQ